MKKRLFLLFFITSIFCHSQVFRNYSNEFLNIGVDAKYLAMSKSAVATTDDVNSIYWNPAGLLGVKDYQGALMHASYFAGIANYDYASFAMPIDQESALGISLIRFGVDDILNTTEIIDKKGNIDFNRIRLFSAADYAFNVGYAKNNIIKNIRFGVNAKIVRRIIGDFASSWGFGFDAGIQFEKNNWKFGLMLRDITTTFNTWSIDKSEFEKIKNAIPGKNKNLPETTEITKPKIQLGVGKAVQIGKYFSLLAEIDLDLRFAKTNDLISNSFASVSPSFGFQLGYNNLVYLRGGVGNLQNTTQFDGTKSLSVQPDFGVGFFYKGVQVDYALTNIGSVGNALYSNIFSIKIDYSFFR